MSGIDLDPIGVSGRFTATRGRHFMTGLHALVRLPIEQLRADHDAGLRTSAFISGYPGSPLSGLDLELHRQQRLLESLDIIHQPAVNEELAATAVFGSQVATASDRFLRSGVLGIWYGKAPGLDRAADALRHGNYAGTNATSGVVVIVGDDPAAKSSTLPSASEGLCADLGFPILHPGSPQDVLELGRHAVALSRASGLWTAIKMVTVVADGSQSVDLGRDRFAPRVVAGAGQHRPTARIHQPFSMEMEQSLYTMRLPWARAYGVVNGLNEIVATCPDAWLGLVASGHTYVDMIEALRLLGLEVGDLGRIGVRVLQVRMPFPMDRDQLRTFADGLYEVLVIEEKRSFIETQVREALYGITGPRVLGKHDHEGATLVPNWGALDADKIVAVLRSRLTQRIDVTRLRPAVSPGRERATLPLANVAPRTPWFCSGCPHSVSTQVPSGSLVGTGIGCHALASRMDPGRTGDVLSNTQMGGEGAQWVGAAPFLSEKHLFQNIGDGTLFHSGWLAIRFAVAAQSTITFKILYNGAISMTGGQEPTGGRSVAELVRGLRAEGVGRIVVTTEDLRRYRRVRLPKGVVVRDRSRLLEIETELAGEAGVTVLIHDQACAAELRRARKRGLAPTPPEKVLINERVCEGCGDCGVKSACLSLFPVETEFGTKTRVDQASCNVDRSCLSGDCPSFTLVKPVGARRAAALRRRAPEHAELPEPPRPSSRETVVRFVGIGGTGVVTAAQIIGMAATLDGRAVQGLDMTGMSQKAGPVTSDLRIATTSLIRPGRASAGAIDLLLAFDLLTAMDPDLRASLDPARTVLIANASSTPPGQTIGHPEAPQPTLGSLHAMAAEVTKEQIVLDAHAATNAAFGSSSTANTFLLGVALQRGFLPVSLHAVEQAIKENGVGIEANLAALRLGRAAAISQPPAAQRLRASEPEVPAAVAEVIAQLPESVRGPARLRAADLVRYQNSTYARRYVDLVTRAAATGSVRFAEAVTDNAYRLMAYKDEYEVARLHLEEQANLEAEQVVGGPARSTILLHPPVLRAVGLTHKLRFGPRTRPMLALLARLKVLRGTPIDPFGRATVRRIERALRDQYEARVSALASDFGSIGEAAAVRIAALPALVCGYEHVKLTNVERYEKALAEELSKLTQRNDAEVDSGLTEPPPLGRTG